MGKVLNLKEKLIINVFEKFNRATLFTNVDQGDSFINIHRRFIHEDGSTEDQNTKIIFDQEDDFQFMTDNGPVKVEGKFSKVSECSSNNINFKQVSKKIPQM